MSADTLERPCIHVSLLPSAEPSLYRWVEIGAEEEGVPTRQTPCEASDVVTLAYQAAQSSRLSIGVGISANEIVLHEQHMPARQPVLTFQISKNAPVFCRAMGANAARMVVRRPLLIEVDDSPAEQRYTPPATASKLVENHSRLPTELDYDPAQLVKIVVAVVRKLQERGL